MPDIFLSYNREDQAAARRFAEAFKAQGFDVWWDTTLRAGEAYDEVTETALREAKAVVVLWSKKSVVSRWVRAEASIGQEHKHLAPVKIEACDLPVMFRLVQTAELSHWKGEAKDPAWLAFLSDVRKFVEQDAPSTSPETRSAAPALSTTRTLLRRPLVLGGFATAAVALLAVVATSLMSPSEAASDNRLTAFFGFTAAGDDPAVATMAGDANAETYRTFAALGLETASEASASNVPLAQQLETAIKLNARYAVGGEVRKTASGFDISLRIDDTQTRKTLWRETISGSETDTVILPVSAAEQAGGTIRCLNRMFKDIRNPSEALMAALPRACASRRLTAEDRVQAWRAAEKLAPDSPAILTMFATSLNILEASAPAATKEELHRETVEALTRALKLEPGLRDARVLWAQTSAGANLADRFRRVAEASAASPGDVEPVNPAYPDMAQGIAMVTVGQFAEAIPILRQAVQADQLFLTAKLWLGISLFENDQKREARTVLENAISRTGAPGYWYFLATAELSNPDGLLHAIEMAPPGIPVDAVDCVRSLAATLAETRVDRGARSAGSAIACLRRTSLQLVPPAASALGDLDEAFAQANKLPTVGLFVLHVTATRPMRADPRFLPLMKETGAWQYWVETKTMPDWCKLPEEQGFETCVALLAALAK